MRLSKTFDASSWAMYAVATSRCALLAVKISERYCGPTSGDCRSSWVGSCATEKNTFSSWP
jgi:hypothetical protein